MKNYKLSMIFGIVAIVTTFFHFFLIGPGFAIAAIVIGLEEYKKAKLEVQDINFKIQTGELAPEDILLRDKSPQNYALAGIILGIVSFVLQILLIVGAFVTAFMSNQILNNLFFWNLFF